MQACWRETCACAMQRSLSPLRPRVKGKCSNGYVWVPSASVSSRRGGCSFVDICYGAAHQQALAPRCAQEWPQSTSRGRRVWVEIAAGVKQAARGGASRLQITIQAAVRACWRSRSMPLSVFHSAAAVASAASSAGVGLFRMRGQFGFDCVAPDLRVVAHRRSDAA